MTEPRRLRDLHRDDAFGAAFRSADHDGPQLGAETKLLATLGLTAAVVAAATPPAIAASTVAGASAAGTVASATAGSTVGSAGSAIAGSGAASGIAGSAGAGSAVAVGGSGLAAKVGAGSMLAKWMIGSAIVVSSSVVGTVVVKKSMAPRPTLSHVAVVAPAAPLAPAAPAAPFASGARAPMEQAPEVLQDAPLGPSATLEREPEAPAPIAPPGQTAMAADGRGLHAHASGHAKSDSANTPIPEWGAPAVSTRSGVDNAPSALLEAYGGAAAASSQVSNKALPAPVSARSLAPELKALDGVRSLLAAGQIAEALIGLDLYQKAFPNGALAQEAEVLRLDALVRSGKRSAAESRARAFLQQHPQSLQAARIRALLARDEAHTAP